MRLLNWNERIQSIISSSSLKATTAALGVSPYKQTAEGDDDENDEEEQDNRFARALKFCGDLYQVSTTLCCTHIPITTIAPPYISSSIHSLTLFFLFLCLSVLFLSDRFRIS